jgi:hypothetical protein
MYGRQSALLWLWQKNRRDDGVRQEGTAAIHVLELPGGTEALGAYQECPATRHSEEDRMIEALIIVGIIIGCYVFLYCACSIGTGD